VHPILEGLAAANFHRGGIRSLTVGRLTPAFFAGLVVDCGRLVEEFPARDVRQRVYRTGFAEAVGEVLHWSLFNRSGDTSDPSADFDYRDLGAKRATGGPSIEALCASIPDLVNMRLAMLSPGAALTVHEEHITRQLDGGRVGLRARFHIPVASTPDARMMLDGELFRYEPGVLYLFNNGCVHDAANPGSEPRMHLVFDVLLTRRTFERLLGGDPPAWLAQDVVETPSLGQVDVGEWVPEPGMSEAEFRGRQLCWIP